MNKDYLTSPSDDKILISPFKDLMKASKYNEQLIESMQPTLSIMREIVNSQKRIMDTINTTMPKINNMVIPSELVKNINYSSHIAENLQNSIISSQAVQIPELTKNLTATLDILKTAITPNIFAYQTEFFKILSSIQVGYPNIEINNSYQSIRENQKISSEKYEIDNTIDTYPKKEYDSIVQEENDIKALGILLGKFITSYQKVKDISSHTYNLASQNKMALTIYANSFSLLVEYIANITNPLLISLTLSIITTIVIHSQDTNKSD